MTVIQRCDAAFENAFEAGTGDEFVAWLASNEDAWFFLDSVDEAQLETPRALENAIRILPGRLCPTGRWLSNITLTAHPRERKARRMPAERATQCSRCSALSDCPGTRSHFSPATTALAMWSPSSTPSGGATSWRSPS